MTLTLGACAKSTTNDGSSDQAETSAAADGVTVRISSGFCYIFAATSSPFWETDAAGDIAPPGRAHVALNFLVTNAQDDREAPVDDYPDSIFPGGEVVYVMMYPPNLDPGCERESIKGDKGCYVTGRLGLDASSLAPEEEREGSIFFLGPFKQNEAFLSGSRFYICSDPSGCQQLQMPTS